MVVVRSKAKSRLEEFSQVIVVQSWSCVATRRSRVCGIKERREIVVKAGRFFEYWADSGGFEGGGNNGMGGSTDSWFRGGAFTDGACLRIVELLHSPT